MLLKVKNSSCFEKGHFKLAKYCGVKFVLQNKSLIVTNTYLKELKHLLQTWRILATESLEAKNEKAETIY